MKTDAVAMATRRLLSPTDANDATSSSESSHYEPRSIREPDVGALFATGHFHGDHSALTTISGCLPALDAGVSRRNTWGAWGHDVDRGTAADAVYYASRWSKEGSEVVAGL